MKSYSILASRLPDVNRFTRAVFAIFIAFAALTFMAYDAHAQDVPIAPAAEDAVFPIVINELLTNPEVNTEWIEFIELYNPNDQSVNLEDWRISGGIDYLFPKGATIPAKGYLLIGEAPDHLRAKYGVTALGPYDGGLSSSGDELILTNNRAEVVDELEYGIGFPWPIPDGEPDHTYQLINPSLDNELGGNWRSNVATPGAANNVLVSNAPPTFVSVKHSPATPRGGEEVKIEVKVEDADGVNQVRVLYQVVPPGQYITIQDAAYASTWTPVTASKTNDTTFTATLPASINQHRYLIRYRVEATDGGGRRQLVPFADDAQPNFAYFVYDGLPHWQASLTGAAEGKEVFNFDAIRPLPVFHFIGKQSDIADALFLPPSEWPSGYMGSDELWRGTLVYDGEVFDHVEFRARGGEFRYATGKSNWRINLHRGHRIQMYDNWGEPYPELADKINLYGISQQIHRGRRGEHGMFDSMSYRLYNEAGVAGSNTNWVQLRVIDGQYEYGGGQYWGDFWGLYLSVEHPDGRFLDNHGLPDGNLYKIENDEGDLDNLSKNGPADGSDFADFHHAYTYTVPTADWWRNNLDLESYYSFRTILEFTHDYDVNQGKNYYFFHNDDTNKWMILPWDKDLTWSLTMPGTGVDPLVTKVLAYPEFNLQYQNRVRELRDLLLNQEQIFIMLDEYANVIDSPSGANTYVKADRYMWDFNPVYSTRYVDPYRTGPGYYYQSTTEKTFRGMVEQMKQYALTRFNWMDAVLLTDQDFPATPTLTYAGAAGYPADGIKFTASPFADPQGANTFSRMEWRIARITLPTAPPTDATTHNLYEINAIWESGELTQNGGTLTPPQGVFEPGHLYRARVRYMDNTGRWSHWSAPVQFTPAEAAGAKAPIVISELMYHPTSHANWPKDELDFLELHNNGASTVDLSGWRVEDGVEYIFPQGTLLEAGNYLVLAETMEAYQARYGLVAAGQYDGSLSNGGERITLVDAWGRTIFSVEYSDDSPWPEQADGDGYSLVYLGGDPDAAASWRRSTGINGSPGEAEPSAVVINEVVIAPANARAVELYNPGNTVADVSHWFLSDDYSKPRRVQLPANSLIPAGGYLVINAATLGGSSYDGSMSFAPQPRMEIALTSGRQNGSVTGYQTFVHFSAPDAGASAGSYVDSQGVAQFPLLSTPTLGAANAAPKVGPLVISELLYRPAAEGEQYIELTNISGAPVTLGGTDPLRTWQLQGGYFAFPGGFSLPAGGKVLVTAGSPHAACDDMAERGYARIFGPFVQPLSNSGQSVTLLEPATIGGFVQVDRVDYRSSAPWPALSGGVALLRSNLNAYGNDPANWQVAAGVSPQPLENSLCAFTVDSAASLAGLSVENGAPVTGPTITWTLFDSADNFASFRLIRSTKASGEPWVEVALLNMDLQTASATHTAVDATAEPDVLYYYALEAYSAADAQGTMTLLGMTTTALPWEATLLPLVNR